MKIFIKLILSFLIFIAVIFVQGFFASALGDRNLVVDGIILSIGVFSIIGIWRKKDNHLTDKEDKFKLDKE